MRPILTENLDSETFKKFYYLKEELVEFCRKNKLQTTGGKIELTNRIAHYLETGEKLYDKNTSKKANYFLEDITLETRIEENFICSEKHREFYKTQIGNRFSFNVIFQKWLKENAGKTYKESIQAYYEIVEQKKKKKSDIGKQFEYNTYIRDFFKENSDRNLEDAIKCWNYKKNLEGHNQYEKTDLIVLEK